MSYVYRHAEVKDAKGVYEVAHSVSRAVMTQNGADETVLSKEGFLLYPLAANDRNQENYAERIELSSHFWVASDEESAKVVAFIMGYTLAQMKQITRQNVNDRAVLQYFGDQLRSDPDTIYIGQIATHANHKEKGIMTALFSTAMRHPGSSPAAIAEIAQAPLRNKASSDFFTGVGGFRMVATRIKDANTLPRTSGTFMRTFPASAPGADAT